jgi:hypothetical protein
MPYPTSRICSGCKEVFNAVECNIDIGDFWNLPEELAWACSTKCANDAKDNWLKPKNKMQNSANKT